MRLVAILLFVSVGMVAGPPVKISWVAEGPDPSFEVTDDAIEIAGRGKQPNFLRSDREFENFRLRFEYRLAEWSEAAVVVRAPRNGAAWRTGISLTLAHDFHKQVTPHITGAITGVVPPLKPRKPAWGSWHNVEIEAAGSRFKASIDGQVVQDLETAGELRLKHRLRKGFIVFPDMGHRWWVRNVRVEDLGSPTKFVDLFDGHSLTGWTPRDAAKSRVGQWSVRDGAIVGDNGDGILYAAPELMDFELTLGVRSHNRANGGVFLRGRIEGYRGFEVQIYSPPDAVYPTGSIYNLVRSSSLADFEERWFTMQIRVEGRRCWVRLDGELVAETSDLPLEASRPGRIGLQIHLPDSSVEFRDVRVLDLSQPKIGGR